MRVENQNNICKNCGYEKGVHSMLNYYCPSNDPYIPDNNHEFDIDSFFESIKPPEDKHD